MNDDLDKKIKAYVEEQKVKEKIFKDTFDAAISPLLPIAILFTNETGFKNAKQEQLEALFESKKIDRLNRKDELNGALECLHNLIEHVHRNSSGNFFDYFLIINAKETGFDATRLMGHFETQFYITTAAQMRLIDKLNFVSEEFEYLQSYNSIVYDKLWEIYNLLRNDFIANGFSPNDFSNSYRAVQEIKYKEDALSKEISKLIDSLKHN